MACLIGGLFQRDDVAIPDKGRGLPVVAFADAAAEDVVPQGDFLRGVLEMRTGVFFEQIADDGGYIAGKIITINLRGNTTIGINDIARRIEGKSLFS
ncbi:hypothetical protein HZU75_06930 [Chitinibacter fontanus]|uniref:Uncharacterized protein n=1 Tax=Chitinibacter fontanus TaxID=1737446 RepID=A0A7D5V9B4_9NEIS|nr:hypothetical protein [Chitinibacter fontanus]QLI81279.1 hypothetical protein HZU75_06930 [Chitinibacter fontanus]